MPGLLQDFCPVALNICGHHLADAALGHARGRLHGGSGGLGCQPAREPDIQKEARDPDPYSETRPSDDASHASLDSTGTQTRVPATSGSVRGPVHHHHAGRLSAGHPHAHPGNWQVEGDGPEEHQPNPTAPTSLQLTDARACDKSRTRPG